MQSNLTVVRMVAWGVVGGDHSNREQERSLMFKANKELRTHRLVLTMVLAQQYWSSAAQRWDRLEHYTLLHMKRKGQARGRRKREIQIGTLQDCCKAAVEMLDKVTFEGNEL